MFYSLPRLSEALAQDELRPQMSHLYVTREYIYASDAHVLVRLKTQCHFEPDSLPYDAFYLDVYTVRSLQRENLTKVYFTKIKPNNWLICIHHIKGGIVYYPVKTDDDIGGHKYPNADPIMDLARKNCTEKIEKVGLNANYVHKIQRALGAETSIQLYFQDPNSAIYVLPSDSTLVAEGREGILMPVVVNK